MLSTKSVAPFLLASSAMAQRPTDLMPPPIEHHGKAPRHAKNSVTPEQIHLALGESPDLMRVQWATFDVNCSASETVVSYGTDTKDLSFNVEGDCFSFQPASVSPGCPQRMAQCAPSPLHLYPYSFSLVCDPHVAPRGHHDAA